MAAVVAARALCVLSNCWRACRCAWFDTDTGMCLFSGHASLPARARTVCVAVCCCVGVRACGRVGVCECLPLHVCAR
eukprot:15459482-Alexandrium_andersonii.AAC.1